MKLRDKEYFDDDGTTKKGVWDESVVEEARDVRRRIKTDLMNTLEDSSTYV